MNSHWQAFAADVPWFMKERQIEVGPLLPAGSWQASAALRERLPRFTALSRAAWSLRSRPLLRHVTPLEGCPDYTLYRLRGAPRFEDWVEAVADQWARATT
jgi:hypothetical protein